MNSDPRAPLIHRLASISLSFYLIGALFAWLAGGIVLTLFPEPEAAIYGMNDRLVLNWLLEAKDRPVWLLGWFLGLCLLNFFLVVNLAGCLTVTLWKRLFINGRLKSVLLFALHIIILAIMAGHLANMLVGFKQEGIKLTAGETAPLPDGYGLVLEAVHFTADPNLLKNEGKGSHAEMSRDRFKIANNYVRVRLTQEGEDIAGGLVHVLSPLKAGSLRVTLRRFFIAKNHPDQPVGAILTAAKNPIHETFFLTYALMIFCLLAYILSVKNNLKRRNQ